MRIVRKACGGVLATSLFFGSACVFSGCDSGGGDGVKPIETDILKKLGKASQAQGELAKTKAMEKIQQKK
jgi:hypothetical protein